MVNKKKIVLLSVIGIFLVLVGIYFVGKSTATIDSTILKDQEVDKITFTDAVLESDKGISTLVVKVSNNNKEDYSLKTITIKFIQEDDSVIEMLGYVGESITSDTSVLMTASIDKDLTKSKSLEYIINK